MGGGDGLGAGGGYQSVLADQNKTLLRWVGGGDGLGAGGGYQSGLVDQNKMLLWRSGGRFCSKFYILWYFVASSYF